jgi:hypothetical protein
MLPTFVTFALTLWFAFGGARTMFQRKEGHLPMQGCLHHPISHPGTMKSMSVSQFHLNGVYMVIPWSHHPTRARNGFPIAHAGHVRSMIPK